MVFGLRYYAELRSKHKEVFWRVEIAERGFVNKTIRQMISRYAPPIENHTENYIKFVSECSGIFADVELDTNDPAEMIPVVSAMSQIENGIPAISEQIRQGWELFMKHKP